MEIATLFVPIISAVVGYMLRHVDVFGQGKNLPASTALPAQVSHPVLTELARLIAVAISQSGAVATTPSTPTVPSAPS